jgi:hypothetical protein
MINHQEEILISMIQTQMLIEIFQILLKMTLKLQSEILVSVKYFQMKKMSFVQEIEVQTR